MNLKLLQFVARCFDNNFTKFNDCRTVKSEVIDDCRRMFFQVFHNRFSCNNFWTKTPFLNLISDLKSASKSWLGLGGVKAEIFQKLRFSRQFVHNCLGLTHFLKLTAYIDSPFNSDRAEAGDLYFQSQIRHIFLVLQTELNFFRLQLLNAQPCL